MNILFDIKKNDFLMTKVNFSSMLKSIEQLTMNKYHDELKKLLGPSYLSAQKLNLDLEDMLNDKIKNLSMSIRDFVCLIIENKNDNSKIEKLELKCNISSRGVKLFSIETQNEMTDYLIQKYENQLVNIQYVQANKKEYLEEFFLSNMISAPISTPPSKIKL